jgi:hypothetical protein
MQNTLKKLITIKSLLIYKVLCYNFGMKNLNNKNFVYFVSGLIDSDGSITWTWNRKDKTFIPSVSITLKSNWEVLYVVKDNIGGYVCNNGNWQYKTIKDIQIKALSILFVVIGDLSSCKLVSSKRYDALLLHEVMKNIVEKKQHRKAEGKKIIIDMRNFLHFGKSRAGAKTSAELEALHGLPTNSSHGAAKLIAESLKFDYQSHVQAKQLEIQNGSYLNEWQVLGFFFGDGGVHVVWGTQLITTTIGLTGDSESYRALEMYAASIIRDGTYRKAWRSSKSNSSRLIIHGVNQFKNSIEPFFQQYPMPNCPKKEIVTKVCETALWLTKLQQKQNNDQPWDDHDWNKLSFYIHLTWEMNPSGKRRKFESPDIYLMHLKDFYQKGKLKIR